MTKALPALYVTNFSARYTGVSATAATILRHHLRDHRAVLIGRPLPGCPAPVSLIQVLWQGRRAPRPYPFAIWHVRRNSEMQLAIMARDLLRLPIRIVFTSAAQRVHSAWPRWLIGRMDAVIATTEKAAHYIPNACAIIPHGVDVTRFHPAADPAQAWRATGFPGAYGIVSVGRIRPEKGTDLFVDAMIAALPQLPGATALVVGQARPEHAGFLRQLQGRVQAAGLSGRILFPGELPPDDLPGLLQGCRALLALPRYEGFGLTPLEAMATGLPVVVSDTGHFRTLAVPPDQGAAAGVVVPVGDSQAAASALLAVLHDAARYQRLAEGARARAVGHFSDRAEAEAIWQVYQGLWAAAGELR